MIERDLSNNGVFEGDTFQYRNVTAEWCLEEARTATDPERRVIAVAGVLRAVLDVPLTQRGPDHLDATKWASDLLLKTCVSEVPVVADSPSSYIRDLPPAKGRLDAISVAATRANRPLSTAEMIQEKVGESSAGVLLVALGHGGTIAAADTFQAFNGGDNQFFPVRFSRMKHKDKRPVVGKLEAESLRELAVDRSVVLFDEDRSSGRTMRQATDHFSFLLEAPVFNATITAARRPYKYEPLCTSPNDRTRWY